MSQNWVQRLAGKLVHFIPTTNLAKCFDLDHCSVRGFPEPTFQTVSDRRGIRPSHLLYTTIKFYRRQNCLEYCCNHQWSTLPGQVLVRRRIRATVKARLRRICITKPDWYAGFENGTATSKLLCTKNFRLRSMSQDSCEVLAWKC